MNAAHRFRWVYCQLEVLRRTLPVHLQSVLNDMPKSLDETYERALLAIDGEVRQYAQRIFQCLAVSIRPLRVEELADILAFRFDVGALPKFNPDWRLGGDAEEAVLFVCSNLISVVNVGGSRVVQFSHFSVKEFLTSDRLASAGKDISSYRIIPGSGHATLAQASLSVLLELDDHIDRDSVKNIPLSSYAAQHWVDHGRFEGVSSGIQLAMEQLFDPDKPHFSAWVWIYDMDDLWRGEMPTERPERPEATPLYYAVLCGFRRLIEGLMKSYPGDVDARGGYYQSPLVAAFVQDDLDTALSLLEQGADVNVLDRGYMSPLHRASASGRIDFVRLLLEHNADVNLCNPLSSTPLAFASETGETEIVHLLLLWGANVNSQDTEGATPLHVAAQSGHLDVARSLIESGAKVDSRAKYDWTPLHYASQEGHVKMAELLIQHGADVGSPDIDGDTSLHQAAPNGHVDIVKLLLNCGADYNTRNHHGKTPSDLASDYKKLEIASLLSQPMTSQAPDDAVNPTVSSINPQDQRLDVMQVPRSIEENVKPFDNKEISIFTASVGNSRWQNCWSSVVRMWTLEM